VLGHKVELGSMQIVAANPAVDYRVALADPMFAAADTDSRMIDAVKETTFVVSPSLGYYRNCHKTSTHKQLVTYSLDNDKSAAYALSSFPRTPNP
jgi:hypothetical protein